MSIGDQGSRGASPPQSAFRPALSVQQRCNAFCYVACGLKAACAPVQPKQLFCFLPLQEPVVHAGAAALAIAIHSPTNPGPQRHLAAAAGQGELLLQGH
jgi:hypothetical protein